MNCEQLQLRGLLDVPIVSRFARALLRAPFRGFPSFLRVDGVGERRLRAVGHARVVGQRGGGDRCGGGVLGRTGAIAAQRLRLLDELLALGLAVDAPFGNGSPLLLNVLFRRAQRSLRRHFLRVLLAAGERRRGRRLFVDDHRILVSRLQKRLGALLGQLLGLLLVGLAHRC
jgi:hypothetical protein